MGEGLVRDVYEHLGARGTRMQRNIRAFKSYEVPELYKTAIGNSA